MKSPLIESRLMKSSWPAKAWHRKIRRRHRLHSTSRGFLIRRETLGTTAGKALQSMARQAAGQMGRQLVRGLLGSLLGNSKRK